MTGADRFPGLATLAIHAGAELVQALDIDGLRADSWRSGSRVLATLEERVAALEGGTAAVAVASGAISRAVPLQLLLRPGDQLIAARSLSARSERQFNHFFNSFGWRVDWAETDDIESFAAQITPKTQAIFVESMA